MKQLNGGVISSIEVWKGHRRATKECKGLIGLKRKNGPANPIASLCARLNNTRHGPYIPLENLRCHLAYAIKRSTLQHVPTIQHHLEFITTIGWKSIKMVKHRETLHSI